MLQTERWIDFLEDNLDRLTIVLFVLMMPKEVLTGQMSRYERHQQQRFFCDDAEFVASIWAVSGD